MIVPISELSFKNPQGFIALEGVNGAGKSTVLSGLMEMLRAAGQAAIQTLEPGGSALGKSLRKILLDSPDGKPCALAEMLLFGADRAEHVERIIRPALARKQVVITDRYLYSSVAFQGYGRNIDRGIVDKINDLAIQGLLPDLVILLDLDPAEGLRRTAGREGSAKINDSFEREALDFHTRIREGFLDLARNRPEPFVVIDASQKPDQVLAQAVQACNSLVARL